MVGGSLVVVTIALCAGCSFLLHRNRWRDESETTIWFSLHAPARRLWSVESAAHLTPAGAPWECVIPDDAHPIDPYRLIAGAIGWAHPPLSTDGAAAPPEPAAAAEVLLAVSAPKTIVGIGVPARYRRAVPAAAAACGVIAVATDGGIDQRDLGAAEAGATPSLLRPHELSAGDDWVVNPLPAVTVGWTADRDLLVVHPTPGSTVEVHAAPHSVLAERLPGRRWCDTAVIHIDATGATTAHPTTAVAASSNPPRPRHADVVIRPATVAPSPAHASAPAAPQPRLRRLTRHGPDVTPPTGDAYVLTQGNVSIPFAAF